MHSGLSEGAERSGKCAVAQGHGGEPTPVYAVRGAGRSGPLRRQRDGGVDRAGIRQGIQRREARRDGVDRPRVLNTALV